MKRLARKRVLLVDDEAGVREAIRLLLAHLGLEVTEARNGAEALALYLRSTFDFVVTDYNMPGMRGDLLAREIKNIDAHRRVVMVSGFAGAMLTGGQLPPSIDELLEKPCQLKELARALGLSRKR
jgi:CheY-like chemotaxis protein